MKWFCETQRMLHGVARSWFDLTAEERKAVIVILALFILGVVVRLWHAL